MRAVLKLQQGNADALAELMSIMPSAATDMISTSAPERIPATASSSSTIDDGDGGGSSSSNGGLPSKSQKGKHASALPFELTESDTRKLRIFAAPVQMEIPIIGKNRGKGKSGSFEMKLETYSYPTWERCKVQRAF